MQTEPTREVACRQDLRARTQRFALQVIRLCGQLPRSMEAQVLGKQLLRSGTSPGAQYREAYRAKSSADYVSKVEGVLQELEETQYWLELISAAGLLPRDGTDPLHREADELIAIFVASVKTARGKR